MHKKILIADPDKCTGCRTCELVCSKENISSHIKILKNELFDVNIPTVSIKCHLCAEKPVCIEFCVAGALKLVSYDEAAMVRKQCRIGMFPVPLTL
ncbi:MAG: 4Fe-4S binding protein [Candidatus Methanoperedens sp.]